jgi:hypothetical protein
VPTLLLTPRYTTDSRLLRLAAHHAGWDTFRLQEWRVPAELALGELVFYGEPLLADVIAESLPYVLFEPPPAWLPNLPARWRQRDVRLTTVEEARKLEQPAFIKPPGDKRFAARVYASGAELPLGDALPGETLALVAEPVTWELEFRCFALERQVATHSIYLREGKLAEDEGGNWPASDEELAAALAFAREVLADPAVALPPAVVLDVGTIAGRGRAVIEANAAWAAGIYGCDPVAILPVLQHALARRDALTEAEHRWVRPG